MSKYESIVQGPPKNYAIAEDGFEDAQSYLCQLL